MSVAITDSSPLLQRYLPEIRRAARVAPVLDLACGSGRNGLCLIERNIPVVFADIKETALAQVQQDLSVEPYSQNEHLAELWPVDFEQAGENPFEGRLFGAILVYRYLHRPLFEPIKQAVPPGGIVVYETFTVDQPQYGRPTSPDFLLEHGELPEYFCNWVILHSFEGVEEDANSGTRRAIAQIVALKPDIATIDHPAQAAKSSTPESPP